MTENDVINKRKTKHGLIDTNTKVYLTHRKPEHIMRKFQSFGFSEEEVNLMEQYGCSLLRVKFFSKIKNIYYEFPISDIREQNVYWDRGVDKQYHVRIEDFNKLGEELLEEGEEWLGYTDHFKQYLEA